MCCFPFSVGCFFFFFTHARPVFRVCRAAVVRNPSQRDIRRNNRQAKHCFVLVSLGPDAVLAPHPPPLPHTLVTLLFYTFRQARPPLFPMSYVPKHGGAQGNKSPGGGSRRPAAVSPQPPTGFFILLNVLLLLAHPPSSVPTARLFAERPADPPGELHVLGHDGDAVCCVHND